MGWTLVLKNSKLSAAVGVEPEAAWPAGGAVEPSSFAPEYELLIVAANNTSSSVALSIPVIQTHPWSRRKLPVSVSLVPMFQPGIGLKEWSKLADVLHVIESKHALDQIRAACGAENGRHQFARLRDHLVASHRILGSSTHVLDTLAQARSVV